jgi:hypothetical protein
MISLKRIVITELKSAIVSLAIWLVLIFGWKYNSQIGTCIAQPDAFFLGTILFFFIMPFIFTVYLYYKTARFSKLRFVYLMFTHLNILSVLPMMLLFSYESWINFIALFMGGIYRFCILVMDYSKVPVMIDNYLFLNPEKRSGKE